ncbi:sugar phosphate isomerase/epimerase family protein [Neorhodopirellula pilleata]|uniref:Xylose isomerase-like TIM barrel n=1 Tax=Neorhodopirellula pilleata TaxID=2714738 RepID=A0A5C6AR48_9BACT|nr:sugar phosphate isomerase/epimerase family protein [Neorhodopirellula pilleata]TWU01699.1 Xylose isomerase-like TIM barrel [Neorhodopirellula pilleata]
MNNRRQFMLASASALAVGQTLLTRQTSAATADRKHPICVFTKPFNSLSFDELADRIAELEFDGIEAPIRRGGHIEPEQVPDRLPELVDALKQRDLEITVMTSDINDPDDPLTEKVLRTAAILGIKRYRMQYVDYDRKQPIAKQLANWNAQFRDLAAINHDLGILGLYQNHAGAKNMGAAIWDLARVLDGIPVEDLAVAYDIRHAMVEGSQSWPVAFRMIQPHIDTVYVKDYDWNDQKLENVPLGEGFVNESFFKLLREINFAGPISLHEEYLDHRRPELVPDHLAAIKDDMEQLERWLSK